MSETAEGPKYYLEQVHLKGFKSIDDLSIDLKEGFNIVIGKNGAGKSNFLQFLNDAIISLYGRKIETFKYAELCFKTYNDNKLVFETEKLVQKFLLNEEIGDDEIPLNYKLKVNGELVYDNFNDEINRKGFRVNGKNILFGRNLSTVFIRLGLGRVMPLYISFTIPQNIPCIDDPASVRIILSTEWEIWESNIESGFISNILYQIEGEITDAFEKDYDEDSILVRQDQFIKFSRDNITKTALLSRLIIDEEIVENLVKFSPIQGVKFNENINIYADEKKITIENLKLDYLVNDHWLPWSQLSDGTKRLFHILSEVTYKKSGVILIEEPELGIHPHQFELLMQFLKEQSKYKQFIISTHSPKTLDHLDENELDRILITTYEKDKGTTLKRMSEDQKIKAKDYMSEVGFLSDYWLLSDLEG